MGSKEPIQIMILLQKLQYQRTDKLEFYWSLYRLKPRSYSYTKILQILWQKRDPWGDLSAPKATLDRSFLSSLSDLLKESEHVRITNSQKHFKSTFWLAYFISKNNEIKLAKPTKKEPRKASFPWDLGLIFVQPIKMHWYFRILNFIIQQMKLP